jgi:protein-S-isoprenylcysteine O-methyltransferase Ste14
LNWHDDDQSIPLLLAVVLCLGWIVLCAALFKLWESKWSYFQSFYFFFISLSTIGLGACVRTHVRAQRVRAQATSRQNIRV